jgi:hypothetical protein
MISRTTSVPTINVREIQTQFNDPNALNTFIEEYGLHTLDSILYEMIVHVVSDALLEMKPMLKGFSNQTEVTTADQGILTEEEPAKHLKTLETQTLIQEVSQLSTQTSNHQLDRFMQTTIENNTYATQTVQAEYGNANMQTSNNNLNRLTQTMNDTNNFAAQAEISQDVRYIQTSKHELATGMQTSTANLRSNQVQTFHQNQSISLQTSMHELPPNTRLFSVQTDEAERSDHFVQTLFSELSESSSLHSSHRTINIEIEKTVKVAPPLKIERETPPPLAQQVLAVVHEVVSESHGVQVSPPRCLESIGSQTTPPKEAIGVQITPFEDIATQVTPPKIPISQPNQSNHEYVSTTKSSVYKTRLQTPHIEHGEIKYVSEGEKVTPQVILPVEEPVKEVYQPPEKVTTEFVRSDKRRMTIEKSPVLETLKPVTIEPPQASESHSVQITSSSALSTVLSKGQVLSEMVSDGEIIERMDSSVLEIVQRMKEELKRNVDSDDDESSLNTTLDDDEDSDALHYSIGEIHKDQMPRNHSKLYHSHPHRFSKLPYTFEPSSDENEDLPDSIYRDVSSMHLSDPENE